MTGAVLTGNTHRAGAAVCACLPGTDEAGHVREPSRTTTLVGVGAVASMLSQVLMFSLMPLVGDMLAPAPWLAATPFVALFIGGVLATFPAAILTDSVGRRAALALGASLGAAGGLVVTWALIHAAFPLLVMGALWIGIANGFALHYRHAVAAGGSNAAGTVGLVIGAGALVGFVAPTLAGFAETSLSPFLGAGTALAAAFAHILALAAAIALPAGRQAIAPASTSIRVNGWLLPTAIAALAWFGMMAVMARAPLGLAGCGVGFATTVGAIAWHHVAMYAPSLALGGLRARLGTGPLALIGIGLAATGLGLIASGQAEWSIVAALILAGVGWSLAAGASLLLLHDAAPSRSAIAAHDTAILLAAVGGAFAAGLL